MSDTSLSSAGGEVDRRPARREPAVRDLDSGERCWSDAMTPLVATDLLLIGADEGASWMGGLRAVCVSDDWDAFWAFHLCQEHDRNYPAAKAA